MAELLSSKVVIVEEEPRVRALPTLPTAVLGAIGVAERGPVGVATLVQGFDEYVRVFGGFTPTADLAIAAQGFFSNGGRTLWVVRTVHYTDITNAASKTSAAATLTLQDRAAPAQDTLQVDGKTDGTYANAIRIVIAPPTSGDDNEFNLVVEDDGLLVETFPNLSLDAAAANYVETVVNGANGSSLISVTDLASASAPPQNLPALGTSGPLTGGNDGLTGLADTDFIGSDASATGLRALDEVANVSMLIVPGRGTAAVHQAMITYCEVTRDKGCFAILDAPPATSATGIVTYVETTAGLLNLSEFGAIYWPHVAIVNPSQAVFGNTEQLIVPPSGYIAGVYARIDASRPGGVYVPPAGVQNGVLLGVVGFETSEVQKEARRDLVFPKRVNPLVALGGVRHIDGARTLKGNGNFPTVAERRGVIFIEQTIKEGLLFAKHQNNTPELRRAVNRPLTAFLLIQMINGAFRSTDPAKAFFVDTSDALNPPTVVFAGQLIVRIGLATNKPAEFVVVRISQDTSVLDEQLAASSA